MPNTLAHIGINYLGFRKIFDQVDYKWILIGAIIPDIPWISRRIFDILYTIDITSQVYFSIQSSLIYSIILAGTFSCFSSYKKKAFMILSLGATVHLLSDALQTKWGNGVLLFAPFNWQTTSLNLFDPESIISIVITLAGLIAVILFHKEMLKKFDISFPKRRLLLGCTLLLVVYVITPIIFIESVFDENMRGYKTLKEVNERSGKNIIFDRVKVISKDEKNYIVTYSDEQIELDNISLQGEGTISLKGVFVSNKLIRVRDYKTDSAAMRNIFSYVGLLLIFVIYFKSFLVNKKLKSRKLNERQ